MERSGCVQYHLSLIMASSLTGFLESFTSAELSSYLRYSKYILVLFKYWITLYRSKSISETVIEKILENCVDGAIFAQLTESDLKEISPLLCDRIKLRNLLKTVSVQVSCLSFSCC